MSPRFVLGRENVPCVAEVVNRSLKADCTDFNPIQYGGGGGALWPPYSFSLISPERLELRPSNFLTFSFYLLAIGKI